MNIWTKKSIELANQRDYLDQLFKVYPMSINLKRELNISVVGEIEEFFEKKDNVKLINLLLDQELFPIKDSYVAYLRRDRSAVARNPNTINRLAGIIYNMGIDETIMNMTLPKETNRQIGPLFSEWIRKKTLGAEVTNNTEYFLEYSGNIVLDTSDEVMKLFANKYLGYDHNKGLDFIAKFNGKFVIGEAKFLTDFGGHQNAQMNDALNVIRSSLRETEYEVIKIAILDGVLYIPNQAKMYSILETALNDEILISSLLLRDFLYSL